MTALHTLPECSAGSTAGFPVRLCCPGCRRDWERPGRPYPGCGHGVTVHGGRIVDFLGGGSPYAEEVLRWPDDFLARAGPHLLALRSGGGPGPDALAELRAAGLVGADDRLLPLGLKWAYHLEEYGRQAGGDGIPDSMLDRAGLDAGSTVLDVGCGGGQSLRLLAPRQPSARVGLDTDLESLALGCQFADQEGQSIHFVRARATALPFPEHSFTHVLCRVTLNYVHQGQALGEMARVLRRGGFLYCRAEGPGYDLGLLSRERTCRRLLSRLYDLLLGTLRDGTGWQPVPGTRRTGGRAFATARGITRALSRTGCRVVCIETGPRYLGLPAGVELLARKER